MVCSHKSQRATAVSALSTVQVASQLKALTVSVGKSLCLMTQMCLAGIFSLGQADRSVLCFIVLYLLQFIDEDNGMTR